MPGYPATMKHFALLTALLASSAVAQQPDPAPMTLEQTMLLRCSAAFAIVAGEQERGVERALVYPPLRERGKEFFVHSGARLMDERHLSREEIEAAVRAEAERFQSDSARAADRSRFVAGVMQPCLAALDASGL